MTACVLLKKTHEDGNWYSQICIRGRRGRMVVEYNQYTTNIVSSNPAKAIQHYVIKFGNDLR